MNNRRRLLQRSAAAHHALTAAAAAALASATGDRDREDHEPRTPSFDFRHLIPQVTLKTGDNF